METMKDVAVQFDGIDTCFKADIELDFHGRGEGKVHIEMPFRASDRAFERMCKTAEVLQPAVIKLISDKIDRALDQDDRHHQEMMDSERKSRRYEARIEKMGERNDKLHSENIKLKQYLIDNGIDFTTGKPYGK